ncbi:hypothetical protein E1293_23820 [Actinomadura darangshiensis]|uniref:Sporulation stage II protein D amidase enhancer LytB N-terminal domain-containing protein n=1 Tax=Actinomadura darangshiensis TaxID=705336 RepID=A0A4R5B4S3_9ACTN|nr:SpoIID/LytB domain-containing protein [Actinomadura darangshiensis]TDD79306.1 hypothetical protein E1293_23820 [Actinomadura darangshiensis]
MARKWMVLASLAPLALGALVVTAGPAAAAGRDGTCDGGEFCYYFNSDNKGSISDFTGSVDSYGTTQPSCYEFKGDGSGKGQCIKNNAASVWNRSSVDVRVYFNSNYAGTYQVIKAGQKGNLNSTLYNNNASHQFIKATSCHTDGSNSKLPSHILVYRVSLGRVDDVSFKTYVKNVLPNEWISSWRAESLKAGAMAVKNFGWYWALHSTRKTSWGACFDVYDTTSSQVYKPGSAVSSTSSAVDATWNVRMARSGNVLQAHYCSTATACGAWVDGDWMSQWGSKDEADAGWGYQTILRHWYSDISLTTM